jgi:hypothetical protein
LKIGPALSFRAGPAQDIARANICLQDQYEFLHRALSELFKRQLAWQEDHGYMNWPSVVSQSHNGVKPDLLPNKNGSEVQDFDNEVGVEAPLELPTRAPVIVTMPQNVKQVRTPSPSTDVAPGASPSNCALLDGIPVPGMSGASLCP